MKLVKRHKADDEVRENLKFGGKIITRFYIRHVSYTCMYLQILLSSIILMQCQYIHVLRIHYEFIR